MVGPSALATSTLRFLMSNSAMLPVTRPGRSSLAPSSQDLASSGAIPPSSTVLLPLNGAMVELGLNDSV
ncbi:hypothetical protein D3C78_1637380 [compost metagenome]